MSTVGDKHYFTVEEADSLIPRLQLLFTQVMQMRAQLRTAYHDLERLGEVPTVETMVRTTGTAELLRARARFRALMETLTEELQSIEQTGVTVKDLDVGLCDFLGLREGREVWLCWRYGETRVAFWHDLETGFSSRQPLETRREPKRLLH